MYLHLGQGSVVPGKALLGIFELDNTTYSRITRDFLERAEREGRVESTGEDLPKSFVLCSDREGGERVILSLYSSQTLRGKAENDSME